MSQLSLFINIGITGHPYYSISSVVVEHWFDKTSDHYKFWNHKSTKVAVESQSEKVFAIFKNVENMKYIF